MKQSFELHKCDTDWETRKPADLLMSSSVDAENYDAALKLAKAELKKMQKDYTRSWKEDLLEFPYTPKPKLFIGKLEHE